MTDPSLPFATRLWFSWACWLRVLFDAGFAARVFAVRNVSAAALQAPSAAPASTPERPATREAPRLDVEPTEAALQLLTLLQREGRFVDFVQQDISAFGDAEVAAAARVVHEGCRRALRSHASIVSVRDEAEGSPVVVEGDSVGAAVKLTGNVQGRAPYRGVLRHRGWRVKALKLPTRIGADDVHIVAPAEVEL